MKRIARLGMVILLCGAFLAAPACSIFNNHTHSWNNYIVKIPTCTENGLLEKLCEECGEKEYEDLMSSGHNYQNGACTICGQFGYSDNQIEPIPMPEGSNNSAAWSLEKIYQTAQTFGVADSYDVFINKLAYGTLDSVYLDNLGLLHVSANYTNTSNKEVSLPLITAIGKVSPTNAKESKFGYISKVSFYNGQLTLTYADGVQATLGKLTNDLVTITKFGINPDNELVVYYSNNTIAFAGKVPDGKSSDIQAAFVYRQEGNGYAIYQVINTEDSIISIPISHQGKPVTAIDQNAFKLLTGNNLSIIIPETVTNIDTYAFNGLSANNATIYFEGSASNYTNLYFTNPMPKRYFKGEWSYVNGVPTPNW